MQPEFHNRRVTVMGLGQFGGGVGVVNFLLDRGAQVTLTDLQTEASLSNSLTRIDRQRLSQLVLGEHRECDFVDTDLVVVNPSVPLRRNHFTQRALAAGVPLTTEINLLWERLQPRKLVVTGTVGKSTTASLIQHLLVSLGVRSALGGNIGISLLPELEEVNRCDWAVLELSSFQLDSLAELRPQPEIALCTNFFPNHLDWHGTLTAYRQAKQVLFQGQCPADWAIINNDDPDSSNWPTTGHRLEVGTRYGANPDYVHICDEELIIQCNDFRQVLPRRLLPAAFQPEHQLRNLAMALGAVVAAGLQLDERIPAILDKFQQLPHRLELVDQRSYAHLQFINDSKATTPEATQSALQAVSGPIVLIAGGKDKQVDLRPLCRQIHQQTIAVALLGETASMLASELEALSQELPSAHSAPRVSLFEELQAAVRWCIEQAPPGGTILFSPGCSSGPPFQNYEQRGAAFRQIVQQLLAPEGSKALAAKSFESLP